MSDENTQQEAVQQQFEIQKIYIKDASLEIPNAPVVFTEQWQGESNLQLGNASNQLTDDLFEVVLTVTLTTTNAGKTAYLVEVKQAGIFTLKGFSREHMGAMLGAYCPNTLFPYARETISTLVQKGGFPPVWLQPVNFDALYLQHLQAQQQQAGAASA